MIILINNEWYGQQDITKDSIVIDNITRNNIFIENYVLNSKNNWMLNEYGCK